MARFPLLHGLPPLLTGRAQEAFNSSVQRKRVFLFKFFAASTGAVYELPRRIQMRLWKKTIAAILACFALGTSAFASCDYASDRASDGSRCGGRAASERAGGR